jgi:hypothetical protein
MDTQHSKPKTTPSMPGVKSLESFKLCVEVVDLSHIEYKAFVDRRGQLRMSQERRIWRRIKPLGRGFNGSVHLHEDDKHNQRAVKALWKERSDWTAIKRWREVTSMAAVVKVRPYSHPLRVTTTGAVVLTRTEAKQFCPTRGLVRYRVVPLHCDGVYGAP